MAKWRYSEKGWEWSKDFGCFIKDDKPMSPPTAFALNNKLVHWDYGVTSNNASLRGSTTNHWHGWTFGYDLQKAINWLKEND